MLQHVLWGWGLTWQQHCSVWQANRLSGYPRPGYMRGGLTGVLLALPPPCVLPCHSPPQRIMSTYKFAFTPENSIDEGYVTEKVYAPLKVGEQCIPWCSLSQKLRAVRGQAIAWRPAAHMLAHTHPHDRTVVLQERFQSTSELPTSTSSSPLLSPSSTSRTSTRELCCIVASKPRLAQTRQVLIPAVHRNGLPDIRNCTCCQGHWPRSC